VTFQPKATAAVAPDEFFTETDTWYVTADFGRRRW
jgi:hypothetical protein